MVGIRIRTDFGTDFGARHSVLAMNTIWKCSQSRESFIHVNANRECPIRGHACAAFDCSLRHPIFLVFAGGQHGAGSGTCRSCCNRWARLSAKVRAAAAARMHARSRAAVQRSDMRAQLAQSALWVVRARTQPPRPAHVRPLVHALCQAGARPRASHD